MRPSTQVGKLTLLINGDMAILQVFKDFELKGFILIRPLLISSLFRHLNPLNGQLLFHNTFHLGLNGWEILRRDGFIALQIVVETVINHRTDCQFNIRVQTPDGLSH